MSTIAIIPARGGSKGIPGKNLRLVGGKPLLHHMIHAAKGARKVDAVYVSTDDKAIKESALKEGALVIDRPKELSLDESSSEEALLHAIQTLEREGVRPKTFLFLQCTSPLTSSEDLDRCLEKKESENADVCFSVAPFHRFIWKEIDGAFQGINHDPSIRLRRQDRETEYVETGAFFAIDTAGFLKAKHRFFGVLSACEVDPRRALEIDDEWDLELAEAVLRQDSRRSLPKALPQVVKAVVFDFDGVFTDNKVWLDEEGREWVSCNRSDGLLLPEVKEHVRLLVITKEKRQLARRRCEKLEIPVLDGIDNKKEALSRWLREANIPWEEIIYVGNDVNDLECMEAAGLGVAVSDAWDEVKAGSDRVLTRRGGDGAVREICEAILEKFQGGKVRGR